LIIKLPGVVSEGFSTRIRWREVSGTLHSILPRDSQYSSVTPHSPFLWALTQQPSESSRLGASYDKMMRSQDPQSIGHSWPTPRAGDLDSCISPVFLSLRSGLAAFSSDPDAFCVQLAVWSPLRALLSSSVCLLVMRYKGIPLLPPRRNGRLVPMSLLITPNSPFMYCVFLTCGFLPFCLLYSKGFPETRYSTPPPHLPPLLLLSQGFSFQSLHLHPFFFLSGDLFVCFRRLKLTVHKTAAPKLGCDDLVPDVRGVFFLSRPPPLGSSPSGTHRQF